MRPYVRLDVRLNVKQQMFTAERTPARENSYLKLVFFAVMDLLVCMRISPARPCSVRPFIFNWPPHSVSCFVRITFIAANPLALV